MDSVYLLKCGRMSYFPHIVFYNPHIKLSKKFAYTKKPLKLFQVLFAKRPDK